jgi:hypothetical protein
MNRNANVLFMHLLPDNNNNNNDNNNNNNNINNTFKPLRDMKLCWDWHNNYKREFCWLFSAGDTNWRKT